MKVRALASLLPVVLLAGCSQVEMAPVKGRVTCNGKPVPAVALIFSPLPKAEGDLVSGKAASACTDAAGDFTLTTFRPGDGAIVGTHRVAVVMDNEVRCACKAKSLTVEVQPGGNEVNIELGR